MGSRGLAGVYCFCVRDLLQDVTGLWILHVEHNCAVLRGVTLRGMEDPIDKFGFFFSESPKLLAWVIAASAAAIAALLLSALIAGNRSSTFAGTPQFGPHARREIRRWARFSWLL